MVGLLARHVLSSGTRPRVRGTGQGGARPEEEDADVSNARSLEGASVSGEATPRGRPRGLVRHESRPLPAHAIPPAGPRMGCSLRNHGTLAPAARKSWGL